MERPPLGCKADSAVRFATIWRVTLSNGIGPKRLKQRAQPMSEHMME